MNAEKIRKTIIIAAFVSVSAQIYFDAFVEGFIVALSPIVMAIFIYCYQGLSPAYIACLSGIFSPTIRLITDSVADKTLSWAIPHVLPDMVFFFSYAAIYTVLYRLVICEQKTIKNFPYAVFFSDILSNLMEIGCRSLISGSNLYSLRLIALLALIALCRTAIITVIIIAIDTYGRLLINQERDREYRNLLTQASTIAGELRIMNKNVSEVEDVMKQTYNLYYRIKDQNVSKEIVDDVLSIAKNTHEIKGDYRNVLDVLNDIILGDLKRESLWIAEIISLERANVLAMAKKNNYCAEIISRVTADFLVLETFQMMSVIRNLLTNAVESIGTRPGKIIVSVSERERTDENSQTSCGYEISVRDNGPGIVECNLENLFMEGYSTKFDPRTGNIQRGLGLCLVKDYVENDFAGELSVESVPGDFTEFRIWIPRGENGV